MTENTTPQDNSTETTVTTGTPAGGAAKKPFPQRAALLAGGGVLAGAILVGGGIIIGNELGDDDRVTLSGATQSSASTEATPSASEAVAPSTGTATPSTGAATATIGTADAAEISDVIATASVLAASDGFGGEPTAVDAKNDGGWEVLFETTDGDETEVYVGPDGSTRIVETEAADDDDRAPSGSLDEATVAAIVEAALAQADGVITDIEVDDGRSPYDVTVLLADRSTVEIDLGADFAVLGTDVDRD